MPAIPPVGSDNFQKPLFDRVMNSDNDIAIIALSDCNAVKMVPGTNYTTIEEVAKFYSVRDEYLRSLLYRNGISNTQTPGDYIRISPNGFMKNFDIRVTDARINPDDCRLLDVRQEGYSISVNRQGVLHLLSARTVLATAILIAQSKYGCKSKNALAVMNYLATSGFST